MDVALVAAGPGREPRDQPEPVDHDSDGVGREVGRRVEHDVDVPGMECVLAEPRPSEIGEAHGEGSHDERRPFAVGRVYVLEGLEQRLVCHQGVVGLKARRLRVPLVPHRGRVAVGCFCIRQDVGQAVPHDHRTRAEVRQGVGDRPLATVRGTDQLVVVDPARRVRAAVRPSCAAHGASGPFRLLSLPPTPAPDHIGRSFPVSSTAFVDTLRRAEAGPTSRPARGRGLSTVGDPSEAAVRTCPRERLI